MAGGCLSWGYIPRMSFTPPGYEGSPLNGIDFSWVALDREDHVAWLVTFGSAVVPRWVEERVSDFEEVEVVLAALPERGACAASDTSHHVQEWLAVARRGVFAYDWEVYSGPYRAVAVPEAPLKVDDLPPVLAALARRTRFAHLCFAERPSLDAADVLRAVSTPCSR